MLVNATRRDFHVELFGTRYDSPILVAPVGVQNIMHKDAEEATARACRELNVPMILSTAATRTIEQVAEANGTGPRYGWSRCLQLSIIAAYFRPGGTSCTGRDLRMRR